MSLHQNLKIKLLFPILIILTILFITTSLLIVERERNTARDSLILNAQSFASLSADKIVDNYELYYNSGFLKYCDIINNILSLNKDVVKIQIINYYGKIMFDSNEIIYGTYDETLYGERFVENNTIQKIRRLSPSINDKFNNTNNLEIIQPYIDNWGKHQYSIRYIFSYEHLNILENQILYDIIILSIFFLLISLGLIFLLFYQFITLPIKKILNVINSTKRGSFDHQVDIDSKDEIGMIASSLNDMNIELKKSKHRIERYSKNLEKTIEQKNQLITQLSHDLKTPLGPINNLISMLINEEEDIEKRERLIIIKRNAEYMKNLVINTIDLIKYNSPEIQIKFIKVNVTPIIQNMLFYKKHLIQEKNIKVINNITKELYVFGRWIFVSSIIMYFLTQGDNIIVAQLFGALALGYYQMAYRISNMPATEITRVIAQVTFSAYSKIQNDINKLGNAYLNVVQLTTYLSVLIATLILIFGSDFTKLFLGEKC